MTKYAACEVDYIVAIDGYLAGLEAARMAAIEKQREKIWAWFDAPPKVADCDTVPEAEIGKYAFDCRKDSGDFVETFQSRLGYLLRDRDKLQTRIEAMRARHARLTALAAERGTAPPAGDIALLEQVAAQLDREATLDALVHRMSRVLRGEAGSLPAIAAMTITDLPEGTELREAETPESRVLHTVAGGPEPVIHLRTAAEDGMPMVVHRDAGLCFVAPEALKERGMP